MELRRQAHLLVHVRNNVRIQGQEGRHLVQGFLLLHGEDTVTLGEYLQCLFVQLLALICDHHVRDLQARQRKQKKKKGKRNNNEDRKWIVCLELSEETPSKGKNMKTCTIDQLASMDHAEKEAQGDWPEYLSLGVYSRPIFSTWERFPSSFLFLPFVSAFFFSVSRLIFGDRFFFRVLSV